MREITDPSTVAPSPQNASPEDADARETRLGVLAAFGAYGAWGILGIYYYFGLHDVPSLEVVGNRVIWSLILLGGLFVYWRRLPEVWQVLRSPRILGVLIVSSLLISCNWLTYIWAVTHGHATESSLGYFMVPMVNVAVGYLFLSERLSRLQIAAIVLALLAILLQLVLLGTVPIVSLILAATFGGYGYLRKIVPVGPNMGLFVELIVIAPIALVYVLWLQVSGQGHLSFSDPTTSLLIIFTGVITYLPLMWFSAAAKRLRMSTIGIMQYMNPSLQFLVAVWIFHEDVTAGKLASFVLIWISLALYSYDAYSFSRKRRSAAVKG